VLLYTEYVNTSYRRPDGADQSRGEHFGHARGIAAVGHIATGIVAVGGIARGVLSVGGVSIGILSVGGTALGAAAVRGLAIGVTHAFGTLPIIINISK